MASLGGLRDGVLGDLRRTKEVLEPCQKMETYFSWAIEHLDLATVAIQKVRLDEYRKIKRLHGDTNIVFETPISDAQTALYSGVINVSDSLDRMVAELSRDPKSDSLDAIYKSRKLLKSIRWKIWQMKSWLLRFFLGGWPIFILLTIAIVYAGAYFTLRKAHVSHPGTALAISEVAQSAKVQFGSVATYVTQGTEDPLAKIVKVLQELMSLISAVPPLLAGIAALYAALRKVVLR